MKFYILGIILCLLSFSPANGRVVTFNRVTVGSGLNTPHGDWAGDIDGTSSQYELDIFATIAFNNQAVWYSNTNNGQNWASNLIWTSSYFNQEIAGIDLDDNLTVDAVSTDDNTTLTGLSFLLLHKNNGGASFTTTNIDSDSVGISGVFRQIRFGDMEGDGDIDIIATVSTNRFYTLQTAIGVYWYENTGNLVFTRHLIGFCNAWKVDCFDNDIPLDGHLEVVITECYHGNLDTTSNCKLILYKNNGAEIFSPYILDNSLGPPQKNHSGGAGIRCADFNGDSLIDIVSGNASTGVLYWYENNGGNNFIRHTIDNNCPLIDGIDIGDFEPDGDVDIVAAGRNYWFRWYENGGNDTFTMHSIDTEYQLFDLPYVSYFDGDSCPDIVLTEASSSGHVFAYLNPCSGGKIEEDYSICPAYLNVPSVVNATLDGLLKLSFSNKSSEKVTLEARDICGRHVDVIFKDYSCKPGKYQVTWDIKGKQSGVYFLILKTDNFSLKKKTIIIR